MSWWWSWGRVVCTGIFGGDGIGLVKLKFSKDVIMLLRTDFERNPFVQIPNPAATIQPKGASRLCRAIKEERGENEIRSVTMGKTRQTTTAAAGDCGRQP
ncbi:hypothetical protein IWZ00DRAFT_292362 [Phyllosticta capitalensis]|uniref:Uncharacterized protein n=1 Tax=Phyllosticta capitalensis TaxID=121624 RepID=A0ABR1YRK7_9PEZI